MVRSVPPPSSDDSETSAVTPLAANFESAVSEIEQVVARLEAGELSLADSLAAYARGSALLRFAQGELDAAETQVRLLEGDSLRPVTRADVADQ